MHLVLVVQERNTNTVTVKTNKDLSATLPVLVVLAGHSMILRATSIQLDRVT